MLTITASENNDKYGDSRIRMTLKEAVKILEEARGTTDKGRRGSVN
jgi:hypothetical protein